MAEAKSSTPIETPATRKYSAAEWDEKRSLITQLLAPENGATHSEVLMILCSQHDFHPNLSMLKKRVRKWKLFKKNNEADVRVALELGLQRQIERKYKTEYQIRGRRASHRSIQRYLRRKGISDMAEFIANTSPAPEESLVVTAYTPRQSPEPDAGPLDTHEASKYRDENTLGFEITSEICSAAISVPQLVRDCSDMELFRQTIALNKEYFDCLKSSTITSPTGSPDFSEPAYLKSFKRGFPSEAFQHFDDACEAVKPSLENPGRKFLPEIYEIALNNQLDDSTGIVRDLLRYVARMADTAPGTCHLSRSIACIALRLHAMTAPDRAEAAERLLSNVSQRFGSDLASDQRDVLTIRKTLCRSEFCRYPLAQAVAKWKPRLEIEKASLTAPTYDDCVLIFELTKCYRLLNQIEEAASWIKVALGKAMRLDCAHSQADIRVRCFRALGWLEVNRQNWTIAHGYLQQAYDLAIQVQNLTGVS